MAFVHIVINTLVIVGTIGVVAWIIYARIKGITTGMDFPKPKLRNEEVEEDGIKSDRAELPAVDDRGAGPVHSSGFFCSKVEEESERQKHSDPTRYSYWRKIDRIKRADRQRSDQGRRDHEDRARQRRGDRRRSIYDI